MKTISQGDHILERKFLLDAIGHSYGGPGVDELMRHLKVAGKPEVDDDDRDVGFISAKTQGIELAFDDESVLDEHYQAGKTFPEGAMILTSVEFYGRSGSAFAPNAGLLPDALVFGMDRRSVETSLGPADKSFMDDEVLKWIHDDGLRCLV